jgi:TonB family protein
MKFGLRILRVLLIVSGILARAEQRNTEYKSKPPEQVVDLLLSSEKATQGIDPKVVEVLSDTNGINIDPYLHSAIHTIQKHWYKLIPEEAKPPQMKHGAVAIEVSLLRDGNIQRPKITSSSDDHAMDTAALEAVEVSSPFAPLPAEFKGPILSLRLHFYYNLNPNENIHSRPWITTHLISVDAAIAPPLELFNPLPAYGQRALDAKKQGVILLEFVITKNGEVKHLKVLHGLDEEMDHETAKTIKTWKFASPMHEHNHVDAPFQVEVTFHLP